MQANNGWIFVGGDPSACPTDGGGSPANLLKVFSSGTAIVLDKSNLPSSGVATLSLGLDVPVCEFNYNPDTDPKPTEAGWSKPTLVIGSADLRFPDDGGGNVIDPDCNQRLGLDVKIQVVAIDAASASGPPPPSPTPSPTPLPAGPPGVITTVAGNGTEGFEGDGVPATSTALNFPFTVAFDPSGNLFIADAFNHRIRRVDASTGLISTVAGTGTFGFSGDDIPATSAQLNEPRGVAVDSSGNLFIADQDNHRVRKVNAGP